jgi:hypothetical protein
MTISAVFIDLAQLAGISDHVKGRIDWDFRRSGAQ